MLKITVSGCSEEDYKWFLKNMVKNKCALSGVGEVGKETCGKIPCIYCLQQYIQYENPEEWKPQDGEKYFVVNPFGMVMQKVYAGILDDNLYVSSGNCFKTSEEAEESELYKAYRR